MTPYLPHTPEDERAMLDTIGAASVDDLYADIPAELRLQRPYELPTAMCERDVRRFFDTLGRKNRDLTCFAGAGFYDKYTPAAIPSIIARSEFLTAYTPYQPEISQGTLHYIFEFQSMMAMLTGLDVSNASMYDGSTATAEAMVMAVNAVRKSNRALISATVDPKVRRVVATYARHHGVELVEIPERDGVTDLDALRAELRPGTACAILPQPNYYGIIEDFSGVADALHAVKALMVMQCRADSLAVLRTPSSWGADIACGDAQSLGMPLFYGGPYLGWMCTTKALMRKLPGRIVGQTTDAAGRRCFVLTLQAREQHIRREKATSNICSNQGLMSLFATLYLSLMGPEGMREVNITAAKGAHYLAKRLVEEEVGVLAYPDKPYLNEFLLTLEVDVDALIEAATEAGFHAGVKVGDKGLLIAVTEMRTAQEINAFVSFLANYCHK